MICVWLGVAVRNAIDQRDSVEWLTDQHARVWYDYHFTGEFGPQWIDANAVPPGPTWLRNLVGLDYLSKVRRVDFVPRDAGSEVDLSPLGGLRSLEELRIQRTPISDVSVLGSLRNLRRLYLGYTKVDDVHPLSNLTRLTHLSLNNTDVVDIRPLRKLRKLETLSLHNTLVTEHDYQALQRALPNCKITWSSRTK